MKEKKNHRQEKENNHCLIYHSNNHLKEIKNHHNTNKMITKNN